MLGECSNPPTGRSTSLEARAQQHRAVAYRHQPPEYLENFCRAADWLGPLKLSNLSFNYVVLSNQQLLIAFYPTRSIELKENTVVVVLGASGDLAKKKTVSSF